MLVNNTPNVLAASKYTSTIDPILAEKLRLLSHDLSNEWGNLCGATYFLEQETSLPVDRDQFEAMQRRAAQRLQAIVVQIAQHFPQQALFDQLASSLIRANEVAWSTTLLEQLTPLVSAVKQVLN